MTPHKTDERDGVGFVVNDGGGSRGHMPTPTKDRVVIRFTFINIVFRVGTWTSMCHAREGVEHSQSSVRKRWRPFTTTWSS